MAWNSEIAVNAYLDTVKLCKQRKTTNAEPQSSEYISALAAGMDAQLIVEVCSSAETSTIGLAAAARHTGGRLVCIIPDAETLTEVQKIVKDLGLEDTTEFVIGDAKELLPRYKNLDFAVIDCKIEDHAALFKQLNVNPSRAVVIANNLFDRKAAAAYGKSFKSKLGAKSTTLPIGKGIEVTRIGDDFHSSKTPMKNTASAANPWSGNGKAPAAAGKKVRWVVHVDERTGEEHLFRCNLENVG